MWIRVGVLVAVLLIGVGALAYDFMIARPAAAQAFERVGHLSDENATREAVRVEMGEPDATHDAQSHSIDEYHFPSGMLVRTYKVYVVYEKPLETISRVTKDQPPPELNP